MRAAFPAALRSSVDAAISVIPSAKNPLHKTDLHVVVGDEELAIFGRFYAPEPATDRDFRPGGSAPAIMFFLAGFIACSRVARRLRSGAG